ncbi:MAG: hypothetical protein AB7S26_39335 [Sandaracinaceae bacterium]
MSDNSTWIRGALAAVIALGAGLGCRRQPTSLPPTTVLPPSRYMQVETDPPPDDWPRLFVLAPGGAEMVYVGPSSAHPAFGYANPGVAVRLDSAPREDRARVLVGGDLPTHGWVDVARLGLRATRSMQIEGTPASVAAGDVLSVVERQGDAFRVAARPRLENGTVLGPFLGSVPLDALTFEEVTTDRSAQDASTCRAVAANTAFEIHASPGGPVVASVPAAETPTRVHLIGAPEGGWARIEIGEGPYLTGAVQASLQPCTPLEAARSEDGLPAWIRRESGPVFRVAAGTRVHFEGATVARLRRAGWARALGPTGAPMVDVFVAADDDVALRGLVSRNALTAAGTFDRASLEPQVDAQLEPFRRCVSNAGIDRARESSAIVRFTVELDGTVTEVEVDDHASEALARCSSEAFAAMRFDPGPRNGPVRTAFRAEVLSPPPVAPAPAL